MSERHYDFIAIGGGSGGLAAAQRAAAHGAHAAVVERGPLGGTCVNVGCVPKKVMWYAAQLAHTLHDAPGYGFDVSLQGHDWAKLKRRRDEYVRRLNEIYATNLEQRGVALYRGEARFVSSHTLATPTGRISADHIVIATGGLPLVPSIDCADLGLVSDGFFELEQCPRRVGVIGAGYIAVELAGMFAALGARTTLLIRYDTVLRSFDAMLGEALMAEMGRSGIEVRQKTTISRLSGQAGAVAVRGADDSVIGEFDTVLWAVGRVPATDALGLDIAGVTTDASGAVTVDKFQCTNIDRVYAVGDVTGKAALTPVAIAAGRRLADRLFGGQPERRLDYECIPSVVFSHPPLGTVGLTEQQARERFGEQVNVYTSRFRPMYHQLSGQDSVALMKLIVTGPEERIVGCHTIGPGSDEMLQGFAVAIRMGATKQDFDDTVAIHPTSAEEFVTMT